jgi:hypothetical protein
VAGRYIRVFTATLLGILATMGALNLVVDPYDISRLLTSPHVNALKPRESENARLRKPFDLWRRNYDGVVLGTSQVEQGFDTSNPALAANNLTLYNAGLSEERPFEQALLLRHAAETSGITFAIISLDFLRYVGGGGQPEFLPRDWTRRHAVINYLKTLVSATTVKDSILTIAANRSGKPILQHLPDGQLNIESVFERIGQPDYRSQFNAIDAIYLNNAHRPILDVRTTLEQNGFDHSDVREMLATARKFDIQLYFYFSPSHARQFEIIHFLGLAPLYMQWQAELVCLLTDEATHEPKRKPSVVWDFSGYNSVTTEKIPPLSAGVHMHWYSDPVHYTSATGRAIQNRILGIPSPELSGIDDFGTALTRVSLPGHFRAMQEKRGAFLAANPAFLAEIAALYQGPVRALTAPNNHSQNAMPCAERRS